MDNLLKVSVIIPVYKVEKYLDKCVESVVNQSYKNLEIILVDDGSPDNCPQMCDEWAKKDNRIKVIHKENGGLSDARNVGLDESTGQYVTFLDSDDYFSDTFSQVINLIPDSADIILSPMTNKKDSFIYKYKINNTRYSVNYPVSACSRLFRIEFLKKNKIQFRKGVYHEDIDFTLKILLACPVIVTTELKYYIYTSVNSTSITREKNSEKYLKRIKDIITMIDDINNQYQKQISLNKKNYQRYVSNCIFSSLLLIPFINEQELFIKAVNYVNAHKYLYKSPQKIKYKLIKFFWGLLGLKNTMMLVRKIKHIRS